MKVKNVILKTTSRFEIGKSYEVTDDGKEHFLTDFMRKTTDLWFVQPPLDILQTMGVNCTDQKRAESVTNMFDGDINGFYYLSEANVPGSEEPMKWLLGALAAHMNENHMPFKKINDVLPADYLKAFCSYLDQKKFDRTFAKEIFAELLKAERHIDVFGDGWDDAEIYEHPAVNDGRATFGGTSLEVADVCSHIENDTETPEELSLSPEMVMRGFIWISARDDIGFFRLHPRAGAEVMDKIIADPRFKAADVSLIDQIIVDVIAANAEQVEKAKNDPRVINWFVGQVIKVSKGKASAPVVQEKLREIFK